MVSHESKNYIIHQTNATNNGTLYNTRKNTALNRYMKNLQLFKYLNPGDIIEYSRNEEIFSENELSWAIYIGNGLLVRFDKYLRKIICEQFWTIGNQYFMNSDCDLDNNYYRLPVQEILNRAYYAYHNKHLMRGAFSSDKNFVMWCRYNINKSDIEFSTDNGNTVNAKFSIINRFLQSIENGPITATGDLNNI